jgi:hypothetical protein
VAAIEHHDPARRDSGYERTAAVIDDDPDHQVRQEGTHMRDPSRYDDTSGTPRWVKVVGILALVVALLVVVMLLIGGGGGGGGGHGPQRHGGAGGATPPSSVTASTGVGSHTPPTGIHTP